MLALTTAHQTLIGILMLSLVTVESGGYFLTKVVRGAAPANALQTAFFRAGHAHAAVLLVLSIAVVNVIDAAELDGVGGWIARSGSPVAAILMPAGFFLSVIGNDPPRPNRLLVLVWAGALVLAASLTVGGIGMIAAA